MNEIPGTSALLLGYGREGQSTHRYLQAHHPEVIVGIADQYEVVPVIDSDVQLHTGKEYLSSVFGYDVIVRSPGIPTNIPQLQEARGQGKWITSATNIFFSECPGTVIGITGTKGKSTTTSLIAEILQKHYPDVRVVGNIGRPVLDYLDGTDNKTVFVAELSSHQLEDSRYSPHIAVVLDIVSEHLDYYKDFNAYARAKSQIVSHQSTEDIVVFNPSHQVVEHFVGQANSKKYRFADIPDTTLFCWVDNGVIYSRGKSVKPNQVLGTHDIPLLGKGNLENTLAAVSVGLILSVPIEKIRDAVAEFTPLEHRLEFVGEVDGIRFYNDSLATIPEATIHALEALGQDVETLIAGGFDRHLDYTQLGQFIAQTQGLGHLILFPDTGLKIWEAVLGTQGNHPLNLTHHNVQTMEEAVRIAFEVTHQGKICLLSPASASFNLFTDYRERGEMFKKLVESKA